MTQMIIDCKSLIQLLTVTVGYSVLVNIVEEARECYIFWYLTDQHFALSVPPSIGEHIQSFEKLKDLIRWLSNLL